MEQLTSLLAVLAEKLGTTVEYVYAVLIKQAAVQAWISMGWAILLTLAALICLFFLIKLVTSKEAKESGDDWLGPAFMLFLFVAGLALPAYLSFVKMLTCFLNPEYWALMEILNKLQ